MASPNSPSILGEADSNSPPPLRPPPRQLTLEEALDPAFLRRHQKALGKRPIINDAPEFHPVNILDTPPRRKVIMGDEDDASTFRAANLDDYDNENDDDLYDLFQGAGNIRIDDPSRPMGGKGKSLERYRELYDLDPPSLGEDDSDSSDGTILYQRRL